MHQYTSQGHKFWSDCWIFNIISVLKTRHPKLSKDTKINLIWIQEGLQICIKIWTWKRLELLMSTRWLPALQGVPEAKESFFQYKWPLTPHFAPKKRKRKILGSFWANSLPLLSLISLSNTPKHIKTPSNTLDSHLFSTIFKVMFLHLIFLSLVPYLGFEV